METRANHVLIGAFALAVMVAAMAFALWIGKSTLDREWAWYRIVFREAVTGLTIGGAVQYNGIQVGDVRMLKLDPEDPSQVFALVRIDTGVPVKTDTIAKLTFTGLTGVALIQLSGGSREADLLRSQDNGDPPLIVATESAIQKLIASSEDIATTTNEVLVRLNRLLADQNMQRVAVTLDHLERISGAAAAGTDDIRTVLSKSAAASTRLAELLTGAEAVMNRLDAGIRKVDRGMSRELPQMVDDLQSTLASLQRLSADSERLLAENRGSLADFSQQGLGQVGPLLIELRHLISDLDQIAERFDEHPADYLLGRQPVPEFDPQ